MASIRTIADLIKAVGLKGYPKPLDARKASRESIRKNKRASKVLYEYSRQIEHGASQKEALLIAARAINKSTKLIKKGLEL